MRMEIIMAAILICLSNYHHNDYKWNQKLEKGKSQTQIQIQPNTEDS